MTRFQLIQPVDSHNVTKNLTGHRMLVAGPQICQINRWNNSFQNIYGMLYIFTVWPGKSILCKKTPQNRLFWWTRIWVTWLRNKSRGMMDQSHSANFRPIAWKRIEPGVPISESMLFYLFPSNRTKFGGVTLIRNTKIASQQILKRESTSVARNTALKTFCPPLPYIFWTLWTWGFTRYQVPPNV